MTDARAAAEALFTGPVERVKRRTPLKATPPAHVADLGRAAIVQTLHDIADEADRLVRIARRMQVQNSERDHGAKDDIIKSLAAIKRKIEGR